MKQQFIITSRYFTILFFILLLASCRKDPVTPNQISSDTTGKKQPVGTPLGNVFTKSIGTEGGTVTLPDNSVSISIPAGALSAATNINIQPITNTNPAGFGNAFRLTPHGELFQKPITITFSYASIKDSITVPETLGLSYQDGNGVWQFAGGSTVDTVRKTVSFQSTHFSDWELMPWLILRPVQTTLNEGEEVTIEALHYIPVEKCNCDDDWLLPPLKMKPYPVGDPQPLDKKYIGQWNLIGQGTLIPTTSNEAVYKAPASITIDKTATVTLQLKSQHTLILVSDINLKSNNSFEMRINGGAWKSYNAVGYVQMPGQAAVAFNTDNIRFSMYFPASVGSHAWDNLSGNYTSAFNYWPSGTTTVYQGSYYDSNNDLRDSGGSVTITEFGKVGEYITGTFSAQPAGYYSTSTGKQIGTATIEARFHLKRAQ